MGMPNNMNHADSDDRRGLCVRWCFGCGVVRLGGAVVVVQLWWCMVHGAVVIVACKN